MSTNLTRAFSELRSNGYFARQNFWCCQTCAWAEVPLEKSAKAVFYHNQDYYVYKKGMTFYLSWSGDVVEIMGVLQKWGLQLVWEGSSDKRIGIVPTSVVTVDN